MIQFKGFKQPEFKFLYTVNCSTCSNTADFESMNEFLIGKWYKSSKGYLCPICSQGIKT